MSYKIATIQTFDKQLKRLSKKYPSLKEDLTDLVSKLKEIPTLGTPMGKGCYKIRLPITSKSKGKK